jgi:hypothetical protein
MTPEQLDSKVEIVRRMMVAGLVSQMKVLTLPSEFCFVLRRGHLLMLVVEEITQNWEFKVELLRRCSQCRCLSRAFQSCLRFQEEANQDGDFGI